MAQLFSLFADDRLLLPVRVVQLPDPIEVVSECLLGHPGALLGQQVSAEVEGLDHDPDEPTESDVTLVVETDS